MHLWFRMTAKIPYLDAQVKITLIPSKVFRPKFELESELGYELGFEEGPEVGSVKPFPTILNA